MKVIFAIRKNYLDNFGGDVVQMMKTKEQLESLYGIETVICTTITDIIENKDADVIHIFNIQTYEECLDFLNTAVELNIPTVLSTIYWDFKHSSYVKYCNSIGLNSPILLFEKPVMSLIERIRRNNKKGKYLSNEYKRKTKELLKNVDLLLPNSHEEFSKICIDFGMNEKKTAKKLLIVPNAVDCSEIKKTKELNIDCDDYLLEVARIEPAKNQLNVIKALLDFPEIPIVFAGAIKDKKYYEKVKKQADKRGNVHFLGRVEHDQMHSVYSKAKVHILPSYRESPGLSSLEALYYGCNIVVSSDEFCPVNYYEFDKIANICNPYDIKSIKKSILDAFDKDKIIGTSEKKEYFKKFSYEKAAEITYSGYIKVIENENN
ncbi:MAG: glycosyltransferase [Culicoidibacterales bacterium]